MNKGQKIRIAAAVVFVLVCGLAYTGLHLGKQGGRQPVLEKQEKVNESDTEAGVTAVIGEAVSETVSEETKAQELSCRVVYVHICGAVMTEGVYSLSEGSRLIDGVAAAGGFSDEADTAYHNLACILSDGQKIYIPTKEETKELSARDVVFYEEDGAFGAVHGTEGESAGRKVNINTADTEELMTLSGIGKAKAEGIILYRKRAGCFQSIEELKNVSGIGEAVFEQVKDNIVVE